MMNSNGIWKHRRLPWDQVISRFYLESSLSYLAGCLKTTLSYIWFLVNFVWFLHDFSFDSESVWIMGMTAGYITAIFILVLLLFYKFCCTSEKWIINLFSKAIQKLVKVTQKSILALSSQLSFQIACHSYRLRKEKELSKNETKIDQKLNETEDDLHLVQ